MDLRQKDIGASRAALPAADEDAPLVKRCLDGDTAAFEPLVERHQKRMYTIALRMLDDAADAADCVQEAFLAAYRSLSGFRFQACFATWLTSIVVNTSRNRLKQREARLRREAGSLNAPADLGGVAEQACGCARADVRMERKEVEEGVQRCIAGLEDDQREVLILRDIHDYSYEEIGSILDLPDGTVKSRLFRARLALKDCLKRLLGDRL
ncbi:MAG TPA: sigma-70 family RNA polymerase sigma factor [Deltaproteobacteria bacterium]|nr:sigma-70 family RNA polymerase sigma factor [Deltaproteobacteria bacterium]